MEQAGSVIESGETQSLFTYPELVDPEKGSIPNEIMDVLSERFLQRTTRPNMTPYDYVQAAEIMAGECYWCLDALTLRATDLPHLDDEQCTEFLLMTIQLASDTRGKEFAKQVEHHMLPKKLVEARGNALRVVSRVAVATS